MGDDRYFTLAEGRPVANSKAAVLMRDRQGGGLGLLQDTHLIETLAHFSRERIPERVVHAKAVGFLSKVGKKTSVLQRVSTVGPESGSADTSRDVHGWSMKLYTDEGNLDWVFNNTPVFFIRDPIKFPSLNRSHKRHPQSHLPDATMRRLSVWNVYVQLMSPEEAEKYEVNIFDMTKVWSHKDFPLQQIGRLTMNRNPRNYFADIEQAAFSPSTMVPGFAASADPVLQARLFAYPDAARYRLGVNYQQLPTNAAKAQVYSPFQRDGRMRLDDNYGGDPNYIGSSVKPTKFYQDVKGSSPGALSLHTDHEKWVGEVAAYTSEITDADFVQPAALWGVIGREPGHQDRVIENLVLSVSEVKYPELRKAVYSLFSRVNKDLGLTLQERTEAAIKAT
ncbi:Catalase [Penicillium chrysogenum]|uniref:Catalase n=1 Tax=Penicillium chrysogenum TaxID=5076 RepID=A0A167QFF1_PENCH|nr:Catalase [Penicillium chrysogenum]